MIATNNFNMQKNNHFSMHVLACQLAEKSEDVMALLKFFKGTWLPLTQLFSSFPTATAVLARSLVKNRETGVR